MPTDVKVYWVKQTNIFPAYTIPLKYCHLDAQAVIINLSNSIKHSVCWQQESRPYFSSCTTLSSSLVVTRFLKRKKTNKQNKKIIWNKIIWMKELQKFADSIFWLGFIVTRQLVEVSFSHTGKHLLIVKCVVWFQFFLVEYFKTSNWVFHCLIFIIMIKVKEKIKLERKILNLAKFEPQHVKKVMIYE